MKTVRKTYEILSNYKITARKLLIDLKLKYFRQIFLNKNHFKNKRHKQKIAKNNEILKTFSNFAQSFIKTK